MSFNLETEISYPEKKKLINVLSRNRYNHYLKTEIDNSREINGNTLSNLVQMNLHSIKLPKILSQSTIPKQNKKIIQLKKRILKRNNSNDFILLTGLNEKGTSTEDYLNYDNNIDYNYYNYYKNYVNNYINYKNNAIMNRNKNNEDIYRISKKDDFKVYSVSDLLLNPNEIKKRKSTSKSKYKIKDYTPNYNDLYFLNKMVIRKKPKNIEKAELKRYNHSLDYLKKMAHCYLDYQNKNNYIEISKSKRNLKNIENQIHGNFDIMRDKVEYNLNQKNYNFE